MLVIIGIYASLIKHAEAFEMEPDKTQQDSTQVGRVAILCLPGQTHNVVLIFMHIDAEYTRIRSGNCH